MIAKKQKKIYDNFLNQIKSAFDNKLNDEIDLLESLLKNSPADNIPNSFISNYSEKTTMKGALRVAEVLCD